METFIIYPNLKKTLNIVKFSNVQVLEYKLFTHAYITVDLFDEKDRFIETKAFTLDTSNGFSEWASDDKFIINFIKSELQRVGL